MDKTFRGITKSNIGTIINRNFPRHVIMTSVLKEKREVKSRGERQTDKKDWERERGREGEIEREREGERDGAKSETNEKKRGSANGSLKLDAEKGKER